ncbi:tyrosine-type recombinase/integrase [Cytobacillus oceanisediminis]|uniref:tyrosine-type recombinase/integrase n=1 Tax=Cytobacillus TaxID=2675230 RepID=UPI001C22950D|nr:tyrosine-type recombinase/integrase [Cytobacillus oceanisediminis]MBU8733548.1 tyrosine-type recombinase/integrase [Cytobacillus oceanisediminis]MCM3246717.1 tyrosine-type recombinase/integrase [Cytobacillus oceanisediminis]MCM3406020.1 tyrosine-type recombinase/integrase [Cytobacillus oceanisediminis]
MEEISQYWKSNLKDESMRTIMNEYLLSLKLENKAERTIRNYRWFLERFFTMCTIPLNLLTSEDVKEYLNHFTYGKKEKTVDVYLSALSSFLQFCFAEEYIRNIVIKKRWRPKIRQPLPKYLNEKEFAKVKVTAEKVPPRDRALILFLFSSGCRSSEVSRLSIQDVNLENRSAEVTGKGKRIRRVHFSEECAIALCDYLQTRSSKGIEPLFLDNSGQRIQTKAIYYIIRKLGKRAGMKQSLYPHCCRHTFATNTLARGATLEFIADQLGHVNLNTTRIYARILTEDMIIAYQNKMG